MASIDIGMYNTCKNGCKYFYANYSANTVSKLSPVHDPNSQLIFGIVCEDDIIKERIIKASKDCQL